jgi:hypothetical protein
MQHAPALAHAETASLQCRYRLSAFERTVVARSKDAAEILIIT